MTRFVLFALLLIVPGLASAEAPQRIVSVGGSVTETLFALGLGDRLIAVDSTSLYPPEAQGLPQVGYVRSLAAEPIVALAPDLVLAEADAGPQAVLDQLREAGVEVVLVPDRPSPQGIVEKVLFIADAVDRPDEGVALADSIAVAFDRLEAERQAVREVPSVLFLLSHSGPPMAAGRDTSAEAVIRLAGGRNVIDDFSGYRPLSPEMAVQAKPDVILLTQQGVQQMGGLEGVYAHPALGLTPAAQNKRVYAYDALLLLGFGPRTPEVAAALQAALQSKQPG
ncbi:MAG: hemin ABC transporter substrate-binding protein [Kiloniellales bacterium]